MLASVGYAGGEYFTACSQTYKRIYLIPREGLLSRFHDHSAELFRVKFMSPRHTCDPHGEPGAGKPHAGLGEW